VNVTQLIENIEWDIKCLCECYINNSKHWLIDKMFMWMLHMLVICNVYVNVTIIIIIIIIFIFLTYAYCDIG
jgi:hypothetical protein